MPNLYDHTNLYPFLATTEWFINSLKGECRKCYTIVWVRKDFLEKAGDIQNKLFLLWLRRSKYYGNQNQTLIVNKYVTEDPYRVFICKKCEGK